MLKKLTSVQQVKLIAWQFPLQEYVKMNVDGAAYLNLGDSAVGGLCRDSCGNWLFGFTMRHDRGFVLMAELYTIYTAMLLAWEKGFRRQ